MTIGFVCVYVCVRVRACPRNDACVARATVVLFSSSSHPPPVLSWNSVGRTSRSQALSVAIVRVLTLTIDASDGAAREQREGS